MVGGRWILWMGLACLAPVAARAGFFAWDGRLQADTWVPPYGLQVGGELGAAWQFWGEDPRPKLPPAGIVLDSPWRYGFVRAVAEGSSSGAVDHAAAKLHLEPIAILQLKAGLGRDWSVVPASGDYAADVDSVGSLDRRLVEAELIPIPWPYGYAGWDGSLERISPSGNQAGGFVDPSSGLVGLPGGDVLGTHFFFVAWIPRPGLNVIFFTVLQRFQGSGEGANLEGARIDFPRGKAVYSLSLGRWEAPHSGLPAFVLLSYAWVGRRALDR